MKVSSDQSIFAWEIRPDVPSDLENRNSLLAPSAANFWWNAHDVMMAYDASNFLTVDQEFRKTNRGLEIELGGDDWRQEYSQVFSTAHLRCTTKYSWTDRFYIGIRILYLEPQDSRERFPTEVRAEEVSTIREPGPTFVH